MLLLLLSGLWLWVAVRSREVSLGLFISVEGIVVRVVLDAEGLGLWWWCE